MNSHLSSEQLERALAGKPSPETSAHLRHCAECARDLATSRDLFAGVRQSASNIAEEARHMSPAVPNAARRTSQTPPLAWGLAAAALFLGVLSPAIIHRRPEKAGGVKPQTTSQSAPAISDDALLNSVQDDLTASVPDSLLPLAGSTTTTTTQASSTQRKN